MVTSGRKSLGPRRRSFQELPYKAIRAVNRLLSKILGVRVVREAALYPWQIENTPDRAFVADTLPDGGREYLRPDNPRLIELIEAYRKLGEPVTGPAYWDERSLSPSDFLYFRGQNPFVAQLGLEFAEFRYVLSYYALKSSPAADLLAALDE